MTMQFVVSLKWNSLYSLLMNFFLIFECNKTNSDGFGRAAQR